MAPSSRRRAAAGRVVCGVFGVAQGAGSLSRDLRTAQRSARLSCHQRSRLEPSGKGPRQSPCFLAKALGLPHRWRCLLRPSLSWAWPLLSLHPIRKCSPEGTPQLGHARSLLRQLNRSRTAAWVPRNIMAATCRCQLAEALTSLVLCFLSMACLAPLAPRTTPPHEISTGAGVCDRVTYISPIPSCQKKPHSRADPRGGGFLPGDQRIDLGRARGGSDASLAASPVPDPNQNDRDWHATLSCQEGVILLVARLVSRTNQGEGGVSGGHANSTSSQTRWFPAARLTIPMQKHVDWCTTQAFARNLCLIPSALLASWRRASVSFFPSQIPRL